MHKYIFLFLALTVCGFSYELDDLTGTSIEKCINCICFAKTGSLDINVCGRRLIPLSYWRSAGSLTTSRDLRPLYAWRSCKADNNCILNTIKRFTESFGPLDCNSDGELNCQDRFGAHIWRGQCFNRQIAPDIFNRFHTCLPLVIESEEEDDGFARTIAQDVKALLKQTVNEATEVPGTTTEDYIDCICYAKTGKWDINLCGQRWITLSIWGMFSTEEDRNCISNTIKSYTEQFGAMECNLDGIPTAIFNRFHSCLSHVIEKSRGRYKRSIIQNQNVKVRIRQNVSGKNNQVEQDVG